MNNYFNGSGTIGFTCDNCGREMQGCTWVNGMKFCAKCYQETFGNTNPFEKELRDKIADLEAKLAKLNEEPLNCSQLENGMSLCIVQKSKIKELEAKLAESKEAIKYLKGIKRYDIGEMLTENAKLKQQLTEKENTITNLIEDTNASKEFYKKQFNEQVWLCEELREQLAEKDQDKISFAVEQLNLLYKTLTTEDVWKTMKKGWWLNNGECLQLRQTIDQQIKQLKGVK